MRLTRLQRQTIRDMIIEAIPDAKIKLFGSRTDDTARGGDIDLYVETAKPASALMIAKIQRQLEDALEIKTDVIVNDGSRNSPILFIANETGTML